MNGHDSTREQNMEARMMLAVARRGLALKTADTGEWIRLLNGALQNTGNAIGQLAQFNADGTRRPPRE